MLVKTFGEGFLLGVRGLPTMHKRRERAVFAL